MRNNIAFTCMILVLVASCSDTPVKPNKNKFFEPLAVYVKGIIRDLNTVYPERKNVLDIIASDIADRLTRDKNANLTFICTHNSRRSHMSQVWAKTAAYYYNLDNIFTFSGGTETTACNVRTVTALRQAGFKITNASEGSNPVYLIWYSEIEPPVKAFSKLYDAEGNPKNDYVALMCCSKADKKCPVVFGATSRHAIHYVDPMVCDDTPEEESEYRERCREIALEMFYIMAQARSRLDKRLN